MNEHAELDELLSESTASACRRERETFDRLSAPHGGSLVLFGAGELGRKTLAGLRQAGIEPLGFSDNNARLWESQIENLRVFGPEEASRRFASCAAFVVTIWRAGGSHRFEHTRRQLLDLGCSKVASFAALFWKYPDIFLPYYAIDLPHLLLEKAEPIVQAFTLWEDSPSRCEYLAQMRWRLRLDFEGLPSPVAHPQYFAEDLFELGEEEIFVDCGAYEGDSLEMFLKQRSGFKGQFIAIEPDPHNVSALKHCVAALPDSCRDRVTILPVAVGEHRETVRFAATGLPSAGIRPAGTYEVESMPLDEILREMKPTFIKMDIEGAEGDALVGARRSIQGSLPVLAICLYHRPDHLWRLPLLIRSFSDQYRFFLRAHNEEGWDLVCYAVPKSRLKMRGF